MIQLPYIEPVFRPPSEWRSLILQVTNGCSYNQCTFCDMYTAPQKKFRIKPQSEIEQELIAVSRSGAAPSRVFLADGDAMVLSFRRLHDILIAIRKHLPSVTRVSSYCLPRNLLNKSDDELRQLKELGLSIVYVGCESGDDEVLKYISKGETYASSAVALHRLKQAGIKSSVMILLGMGGVELSEQHAINSARLMNETQPEYLSTLVVSFPFGQARVVEGFAGEYELPDSLALLNEQRMLISELQLISTIFRSDHASNYLLLKGVLGKDKERLIAEIDMALRSPQILRHEWQRGF